MKRFLDHYIKNEYKKEILFLTGYIIFEIFSIFLIYKVISLEINNYFIIIILTSLYAILGTYIVYHKVLIFKKRFAILDDFLKMCNKVTFNSKLKVYLCFNQRFILCLSLNYMSLFILFIKRSIEKQSEKIAFSLDFTCFRLESAGKKVIKDKEVNGEIFMYKGIALVPNSDIENFLDRVEGVFVEAQLKSVNRGEIERLVRIVESYVQ